MAIFGPRAPRIGPPGAPGGPPRPPAPPGPESLYRPLFNSGVCTYTPRLPHARRASFFGYFLGGPGFLCAFPREPAETLPEPRIRAPRGRPRGPPGPPGPLRPPGGPKNGPQDPNFGHFQPPRPLILAPAPPDSRVPGQFSAPRPPECAGNCIARDASATKICHAGRNSAHFCLQNRRFKACTRAEKSPQRRSGH